MKICVAVSGGRDSMALLHLINTRKTEYNIVLFAVNCNHGIRGETSDGDTQFVKEWCGEHDIPLLCFSEDCTALAEKHKVSVETAARDWRRVCFCKAALHFGCDAVATAHHADDNAESVLFNLARGSALSGVQGIRDCAAAVEGVKINLIRPLAPCTREEINLYIRQSCVPYVEDESNADVAYTRNRIRHNIIPELERAVPGAITSIYRFSRLAAEDEEYFDNVIKEREIIERTAFDVKIKFCAEKVIFRRAALKCLKERDIRDYTFEHFESLYNLQFAEKGKKFEFLGLTAYKEEESILIEKTYANTECEEVPFAKYICGNLSIYGGQLLIINQKTDDNVQDKDKKTLKFDFDAIPENAVIRFMKNGDKFKKFGGGTKSLGDFFTDKKISQRVRKTIPLIADGNEILAVCGVEISDKIKVTPSTRNVRLIISQKI